MGFPRRKKKARTSSTGQSDGAVYRPLSNMFFDPEAIQRVEAPVKKVGCETNEELSETKSIKCYCYELSYALVFFKPSSWASVDKSGTNLLHLDMPDINSIEVNHDGNDSYLTIKTAKDTIFIYAGGGEMMISAIKKFVEVQKKRKVLSDKSKKITVRFGGSTKNITICPYSPIAQDGEEVIYSVTLGVAGFLVTNYRVWENHFYQAGEPKPLTHDEYDEVIAANVQRRMMTKTTTKVDVRTDRNLWNLVLGPVNQNAFGIDVLAKRKTQSEIHRGTSDSTETEFGDIVFMKDGKRLMSWANFPDPHSIIKLINSAKAHFSTTPTIPPSSGGEDPIKALKLRFAKGEITKDEFLEMKSMLE